MKRPKDLIFTSAAIVILSTFVPRLCAGPPDTLKELGTMNLKSFLSLPVSGAATAVAWSDDGSRLAAASNYGTHLTVWDESGNVVSQFDRTGRGPYVFNSLCFANGGKTLITPPASTAPEDATLTIWDVAGGNEIKNVPGPAPGQNHAFNAASHFSVSPNGKRAAIIPARSESYSATIYSTDSWTPVFRIQRVQGIASSLAFSADSRQLALGTVRGDVLIVDTATGSIVADYHIFSPVSSISAVAYSPDGTKLAVAGGGTIDGTQTVKPVRVYEVVNGSLVGAYEDASEPIRQLAWVLDGRLLAFVSNDKTVRIWDPHASTGPGLARTFSPNLLSIASSPDGGRLAVADDTQIKVFQIFQNK